MLDITVHHLCVIYLQQCDRSLFFLRAGLLTVLGYLVQIVRARFKRYVEKKLCVYNNKNLIYFSAIGNINTINLTERPAAAAAPRRRSYEVKYAECSTKQRLIN